MAAPGKIDMLVNNAGITGGNGKLWDSPSTPGGRSSTSISSAFSTARAIVPHMLNGRLGPHRQCRLDRRQGRQSERVGTIAASKAGVIGLTKSLGKELATTEILVNCITPAAAKTAIFDQMKQEHIDFMLSKIPMGRFLQVDEAAAMIAWLCSEDCAFTTGAVFDISGGRAVY